MITFHWSRLLGWIGALALGLAIGLASRLPFEQASNIVSLLVGLLVGLIGIAATLWVAARDRELKLGEIRAAIADTKESITVLRELASQMWQPALSALMDGSRSPNVELLDSAAEVSSAEVVRNLDHQIDEHFETVVPDNMSQGAIVDTKRLDEFREQLRSDLVKSITEETRLMMRVAQIATLTPVERFMLRRLHPDIVTRRAYWTTVGGGIGVEFFPRSQTDTAAQRLLELGLVQLEDWKAHTMVRLAPGVSEALTKYEELYGAIHPTLEEQKERIDKFMREYQLGNTKIYQDRDPTGQSPDGA